MIVGKRNRMIMGALLLSLCTLTPIVFAATPSTQPVPNPAKDPVTFTVSPGPGVYWNERKVMDLPVPLFLHYHFKLPIPIHIAVSGDNFSYVEFYVNGVLMFNDTDGSDGFSFRIHPGLQVYPHGSLELSLAIKTGGQELISQNYTIYRVWL